MMKAAPASRKRLVALHFARLMVGVAIVAFLLWKYDWRTIARSLLAADLSCVATAWVFAILGLSCYAVMNRIALRPLKMPLSTLRILKILFQTRFYALFMPGGTNIIVKWYKFSQGGSQPGQALALMAFSRLLHLFSMLLLAVLGVWCDGRFPWQNVRWVMAALLVAAAALLPLFLSQSVISWLQSHAVGPWKRTPVPNWLRARIEKVARLSTAFRHLHWWEVGAVLACAVAGNAIETVQHVYIAGAVGLELPFLTLAWLRGVMMLCAMVPVSLAGLGIREASLVALLVVYGVRETDALAYSLLFYGVFIVGKGLVGGAAELWDWYNPTGEGSPDKTDS